MRVIVLGAAGMLGHKLLQRLRVAYDVAGTVRGWPPTWNSVGCSAASSSTRGVDAVDLSSLKSAIDNWKPQVVVNAIGIINKGIAASDPLVSIADQLLTATSARADGCGARR
jgi:dTDP-4-dehydrorhamnose reductase